MQLCGWLLQQSSSEGGPFKGEPEMGGGRERPEVAFMISWQRRSYWFWFRLTRVWFNWHADGPRYSRFWLLTVLKTANSEGVQPLLAKFRLKSAVLVFEVWDWSGTLRSTNEWNLYYLELISPNFVRRRHGDRQKNAILESILPNFHFYGFPIFADKLECL